MRDKSSASRSIFMLPVFFLLFAHVPAAFAQEKPPVREFKDPELARIAKLVDQNSAAAERDETLDDEDRKAILGTYANVREILVAARSWRDKAVIFEEETRNAPDETSRLRILIESEPSIPAPAMSLGAPASRWEEELKAARASLAQARKDADARKAARDNGAKTRARMPDLTADASARSEAAELELKSFEASEKQGNASEAAAGIMLDARRSLARLELYCLKAQADFFKSAWDLVVARVESTQRKVADIENLVLALEKGFEEARRLEADDASTKAREALEQGAFSRPPLRGVAEEIAILAAQRTGPNGYLALSSLAAERLRETKEKKDRVLADFESVKKRVERVGLTVSTGIFLRKKRSEIPNLETHDAQARVRSETIEKIQWELIDLEDQHTGAADVDLLARKIMAGSDPAVPYAETRQIESRLADLLRRKREILEETIRDADALFTVLADLDAEERHLIRTRAEYARFLDERILWVRSAAPIWALDASRIVEGAAWFISPANWSGLLSSARQQSLREWPWSAGGILLLAALVVLHRRVSRRMSAIAALSRKPFIATLEMLPLTALAAAPGPLLLIFAGWRLQAAASSDVFTRAIGSGLTAAGVVMAGLALVGFAFQARGLFHAHWGWPEDAVNSVKFHLLWFSALVVPLTFVSAAAAASGHESWGDSIGRLAFMSGFASLSVFIALAARQGSRLIKSTLPAILSDARYLTPWYFLAAAAPIALAALSAAGYHYSAQQIAIRLHKTGWICLLALVVYKTALDGLKRLLDMQKSRRLRAVDAAGGTAGEPQTAAVNMELSERTVRMSQYTAAVLLILGIWITWVDVVPALGALKRVELWNTTTTVSETARSQDGSETTKAVEKIVPVTLDKVALALIIAVFTVFLARNLPDLISISVLDRFSLDPGLSYAVKTVMMYVLTFTGIALSFGTIGLSWRSVQWLAAAAALGLGFGLQEIFANFVSGLIMLIERPIRLGDVVTAGGVTGVVTKIRIRATTILDWDRKELVIPNKQFITGELVNWTLSDKILRVVIPVGIAYGSDTDLAHSILIKVAADTPHVLDDPSPMALFLAFGASSLDFELRVFIPHIKHMMEIKDALHTAIHREFGKAGIEIAFPQRDLHIRTVGPDAMKAMSALAASAANKGTPPE